jgi:hypothetical protein
MLRSQTPSSAWREIPAIWLGLIAPVRSTQDQPMDSVVTNLVKLQVEVRKASSKAVRNMSRKRFVRHGDS